MDERYFSRLDKALEHTVDRRLEAADQNTKAFLEMFGPIGESVPEVDAEDIKAVSLLYEELKKQHPGECWGVGRGILERVCKPGADIRAICYRYMYVSILTVIAAQAQSPEPEMAAFQEKVSAVVKDGELINIALDAAAKIPMTWETKGLPFDFDEFLKLCA